jgi:phosphoribosylanthranilate isomerase
LLRLKVAGISSLTDARYCAGMGVEFLSVYFDENAVGSMRAEALAGIRPWIEGVKWIGEFAGINPDKLQELAAEFELDTWIVSEEFETSSLSGIQIVKSINEIPLSDAGNYGFQLQNAEILQEENSGEMLNSILQNQLLFLSEQISAEDAIHLYKKIPGLIFSLRSSGEERPGWMDLGALQDYLEAVEDYLTE